MKRLLSFTLALLSATLACHAYVAYVEDNFNVLGPNHIHSLEKWATAGGAWRVALYSNDMAYIMTTNLPWSNVSLRPRTLDGREASFDAWNSTGIMVKLRAAQWNTTTTNGILRLYVTSDTASLGELWGVATTGAYLMCNFTIVAPGVTNMTFQAWRKQTLNHIGVLISAPTNVTYEENATISFYFNDSVITGWYNDIVVAAGPHGIVPDGTNWYVMYSFSNAGVPLHEWFVDDASIIGPYAQPATSFHDDLSGPDYEPPNPERWAVLTSNATIYLVGGACRLMPPNAAYGKADIMPLRDADNGLRLAPPVGLDIVTTSVIANLGLFSGLTAGSDGSFRQEFLPTQWKKGAWYLNSTAIIAEAVVTIEESETNIAGRFTLHTIGGFNGDTIATSSVAHAFVPGAPLVCRLSDLGAQLEYNGVELFATPVDLGAPLSNLFPHGLYTSCGVQVEPAVYDLEAYLGDYTCAVTEQIPEPGWFALALCVVGITASARARQRRN